MLDWDHLRQRSVRPGGFGEERNTIWPAVLHVADVTKPHALSESANSLSSEEANVSTAHRDERQILLDTDRSFVLYPVVDGKNKDEMKTRLNEVIVSVFRRWPRLNYYQGYHDIISVLFLTLPEDVQLLCAEKMSLYRLRDSHLQSLEPVVGLLRVLKKLLGLVDPAYASVLDRNMPLPYYALSNLLTLFSHDIATLPLIQHVFDFLLVRPPIVAVYLAAALVLCRQEEVRQLEEAGEEGMLHSLLTSLPELYEEVELPLHAKRADFRAEELRFVSDVVEIHASHLEKEPLTPPSTAEELTDTELSEKVEESSVSENTLVFDEKAHPLEEALDSTSDSLASTRATPESLTSHDTTLVPDSPALNADDIKPEVDDLPDSSAQARHPRLRLSLTSLLAQVDDLYSRFPPTHPDLCLNRIMGPNSVVFTWTEAPSSLSEPEAEDIVDKPETVVLPYTDPEEQPSRKKVQQVMKWRVLMNSLSGRSRMRTVLAGAVLVLSVAVALYKVRGGLAGDIHRGRGLWSWTNWIGRLALAGRS